MSITQVWPQTTIAGFTCRLFTMETTAASRSMYNSTIRLYLCTSLTIHLPGFTPGVPAATCIDPWPAPGRPAGGECLPTSGLVALIIHNIHIDYCSSQVTLQRVADGPASPAYLPQSSASS